MVFANQLPECCICARSLPLLDQWYVGGVGLLVGVDWCCFVGGIDSLVVLVGVGLLICIGLARCCFVDRKPTTEATTLIITHRYSGLLFVWFVG